MHEIGLDLVWSAFHGGDGLPEYTTLWDANSDVTPFSQRVDTQKLERGREYLYEAALRGHTYALVEISVSYALFRSIARSGAGLDDEALRSILINTYAYGEAVENLVPGLHEGFFEARIPPEVKSEADEYTVFLTNAVRSDRLERGLDVAALPGRDGEMLRELRFCSN